MHNIQLPIISEPNTVLVIVPSRWRQIWPVQLMCMNWYFFIMSQPTMTGNWTRWRRRREHILLTHTQHLRVWKLIFWHRALREDNYDKRSAGTDDYWLVFSGHSTARICSCARCLLARRPHPTR